MKIDKTDLEYISNQIKIDKNGYIGIPDRLMYLYKLENKIESARYKHRDELNRITWVYDRLLGIC